MKELGQCEPTSKDNWKAYGMGDCDGCYNFALVIRVAFWSHPVGNNEMSEFEVLFCHICLRKMSDELREIEYERVKGTHHSLRED